MPDNFINSFLNFQTLHLEPITSMNLRDSNLTIVVEVDANGKIVDSLQGDSGRIIHISETQKVGDNLFFGSPYNKYLGRLMLNPPTMEVEGKGVRMKSEETENVGEEAKEKTSDESAGDKLLNKKETDRHTEKAENKDVKAEIKTEAEKDSKETTVQDTKEEL